MRRHNVQTMRGVAATVLAAALVVAPLSLGRHQASAATVHAAANTMLSVTPTTTNRGGVVTVTGSGFTAGEAITVTLSGMTPTVTMARADTKGMLPATGVSIPYSLKPGSYTITATGATSKRHASATVTIAALTPSISLSASSVSPGATETVTGKNFGSKEQVTLSLNGEALSTNPAVITTTNGAFTASFAVPKSILSGANTVSAIGNESRVSAVASFTGQLQQSAQFYFAGAINTSQIHSYLSLLNTHKQPASVSLTFDFQDGKTYNRTITVGATTLKRVSVASLNFLPEGTYGLEIKSDRQISAEIVTQRPGMDGGVMLGNSGLDTHWYLAAGSTRKNFEESISIFNPSQTTGAAVTVHFVTAGSAPGKSVMVSVPAHTNTVVDANKVFPNADVSVELSSDNPVIAERTLYFGPNDKGLTMVDGSNKPAATWLFADATTENNVHTIFTVLNPNAQPALVTAAFSQGKGVVLGSHSIYVPGHGRAALNLADVVHGGGIAAQLTSNVPVVVERAEYIGKPANAPAASVVFGRNGAATSWTFPGGDTTPGMNEVLDLYNPSAVTVPITATFYATDGHTMSKSYTIDPTARIIIPVNALGLPDFHGAILSASTGQGFIAEQGISVRDSHLLRATQGMAG